MPVRTCAFVATLSFAPFVLSCASTPPPPRAARIAPPSPRRPIRHWVSHTLEAQCRDDEIARSAPPPPSEPSPSPAPSASESDVEIPPALLRYPLLGRLNVACGSSLGDHCLMPGAWRFPEGPEIRPGPAVLVLGGANDCVTRRALHASLDVRRLEACFAGQWLPCREWHWVTASLQVDPPRSGRVTAMTGHERVSVSTASCIAQVVRGTHWVEHEGPEPVVFDVAVVWRQRACLR